MAAGIDEQCSADSDQEGIVLEKRRHVKGEMRAGARETHTNGEHPRCKCMHPRPTFYVQNTRVPPTSPSTISQSYYLVVLKHSAHTSSCYYYYFFYITYLSIMTPPWFP